MNRKIVYEHDAVPIGYYDKIYKKQRGLQSKWHHQKFNFNKKKLYKFISQKPFKSIKINSFIYFAPFFSNLSWKLSNFVENIEKLFLKLPCGFLLFGVFKK